PAPHSIFRAIRKLAAGHWLTYADGGVRIAPYWDVHFHGGDALGEADAVEALRTLLDLSVRQHLVSDVPLGVFLSGGIDSSAVAAFAARHFPGRLKTFSIGFEDPSFDETAHARGVARALDTDHHEEILGPRVALDLVATRRRAARRRVAPSHLSALALHAALCDRRAFGRRRRRAVRRLPDLPGAPPRPRARARPALGSARAPASRRRAPPRLA